MGSVQQASPYFFLPVAGAYLAVCGLWLSIRRWQPQLWPPSVPLETSRPWLDAALSLAAVTGVLFIGAVYRAGYLLPVSDSFLGRIAWTADTLLIYSPIFVVLAFRRQSLATVFLSPHGLPQKLALGAALGMAAVLVFLASRGEMARSLAVLARTLDWRPLSHSPAVFLEGVAVAFVFVRLRWAVGLAAAIALPAILFAAAHVPGALADGSSATEIMAFFLFNCCLVSAILYVVQRSQDVIWIGLVHYLMDVAIEAI